MVFTGATANAGRIIDHRITAPVAVLDHRDGLRQAMACTIAADNAIPRDEALLLVIAGQPNLGLLLFRQRQQTDCTGRTGRGTEIAVVDTVPLREVHMWLQEVQGTIFWARR